VMTAIKQLTEIALAKKKKQTVYHRRKLRQKKKEAAQAPEAQAD
jgi:hypothetical protein